jgi:hypothetical protein
VSVAPWTTFLASRRAACTSPEELALIVFVEEIAGLADRCDEQRGEGPTVNRTSLVRRIRDALTGLSSNYPSKEN